MESRKFDLASCEAHLPEPAEAPELLVDLVLEFIASASHFDEPLRARRWALRYLRDLQLQAEQCELVDTFIAEDTFETPADLFSLLALRTRQPGISLKLLDRISELADQEQSWSQAADTFMAVDLEHLVSGIPKSLIPRRAARYYDPRRIKKLRFALGARCSSSSQGIKKRPAFRFDCSPS